MTPLLRPLLALAVALGAAGLPALAGPAQAAVERTTDTPPTAGQAVYVPLDPARLLDTREGSTLRGDGAVLDLTVVGRGGVPATATAVVLTVTAVRATSSSDVRVYPKPADGSMPGASNLNAVPAKVIANLVTVKVGQDGQVRLRNSRGSVDLIADVSGYYAEGVPGSSYVGATPTRLLDTREGGGTFGPQEVRRLQVAGGSSAAPAGATAVVLNITAVAATSQTDIRAYPSRTGREPAPTSVLGAVPGPPTASAAIVTVGENGSIDLRNGGGRVHLVVDLAGWYLPGTATGQPASVFHPVVPYRVLDTREAPASPVGGEETRDVVLAGRAVVPAPATALVLNVTAVGRGRTTDVRVYPTPSDSAVPGASNLNVAQGQVVANAVLAAVGRDGSVRLRNTAGSVDLIVDVAGWFGPAGRGTDISWPQCTSRGSTTSRLPDGGAFAVVGLTRSGPFTDNECFAAQWAWANTLPGEPMVYLNLDAPGVRDGSTEGQRVWAEVCGTGTPTSACGLAYGERIGRYALDRLPRVTRHGGRPQVWMDVEGPYANGPFWQTGYAGAVAVNRSVIQGVVNVLRAAGYRVGTYSDRASVGAANNDWNLIVGQWQLLEMQNWVFRSPDADGRTICGPEHSFSGGPVVMAQVQPATNPGAAYDVDDLC